MATAPSLLADREEPVHRTRHRAAHEQEIPLGVYLHDPQAQLSEAPRAHMARHALSLDDARGVGARGDRARLAVTCVAVRLRPTPEVMAVHHAWKPRPFVTPVTFTRSPAWKIATVTASPGLGGSAPSPASGKLWSTRGATSRPARFTWPSSARAARFGFLAPKPSSIRFPAICTTGQGPASITAPGPAAPSASKTRVMPSFLPISPVIPYSTLISTSTPAGRSSFVSASTVWERVSMMSISRLWVFSSNCSTS